MAAPGLMALPRPREPASRRGEDSKGEPMSDNTALRGPQDRSRVNMSEDYEVRYWTEKFGVSKERLATAVNEVGSSVSAIERYLQQSQARG